MCASPCKLCAPSVVEDGVTVDAMSAVQATFHTPRYPLGEYGDLDTPEKARVCVCVCVCVRARICIDSCVHAGCSSLGSRELDRAYHVFEKKTSKGFSKCCCLPCLRSTPDLTAARSIDPPPPTHTHTHPQQALITLVYIDPTMY